MVKFLLKRLVALIPTLLLVTIAVFCMVQLMPGDPARLMAGEMASEEQVEQIRKLYGYDKPMHEQYFNYMSRVLRGDFGTSTRTNRSVNEELSLRFPNTMRLAVAAIVIAFVIGTLVGVLSATKRNSIFDNVSMLVALVGLSIPPFYLGLLLILQFSVNNQVFPILYNGTLASMVLPAITLSARSMATIARMTRSSMLEVMSQDFITTARAQGLSERKVVFNHALKNSMNAIVTVAGLQFGYLLGGAVITERTFSWPGLGDLVVTAIRARDFAVVQSAILVIAISFVFVNLLVDVLYVIINPRIKLS